MSNPRPLAASLPALPPDEAHATTGGVDDGTSGAPDPLSPELALLPKLGNGTRSKREQRCLMLQVLQAHFGERIPAAALKQIGFAQSAWTHGPYWKGLSPGALAAYDMNAIAGLHKAQGHVYITLTPIEGKILIELSPDALRSLACNESKIAFETR